MIKRYALSVSKPFESDIITDHDEEWLIVSELPTHIHDYEALIEIEQPILTPLFTDYGFESLNERFYLYESLVTAFSIADGDPIEIDMFLLQLEEYMIAQEKTDTTIYYIAKQYEELLTKVAATYDVTIRIFDLDKYEKND
ncbi:hypothetical protein HNQ34_001794 [Anoxybacillus tepidamans]|uniref:Uncharacterized protein n=1 Tax=Anoxybacteroides tepidamans TaxID=265948 RepID=A0A7W8IQ58_9BACL|nr:hypothetical protein [Anoxybacillus tepidamans]MBB5324696.1 hypothetical protein [Anoxybacillus tepidamans]